MKVEVTYGLLSFISAFILLGWGGILLIKLQIKPEHRLINENKLERNSCLTFNGLLTRFLWIVLIVSILWLIECIFTFRLRLWSISIIDANDITNKNNEHDVTIIVLYFVFDLIALVLLLILYYFLSQQLPNLYHLNIINQDQPKNIHNPAKYGVVIGANPVVSSEKNGKFYTHSERTERRKLRMERHEIQRQNGYEYEQSMTQSHSSDDERKRDDEIMMDQDEDEDDMDSNISMNELDRNDGVEIYEEQDTENDGDAEEETETQYLPSY